MRKTLSLALFGCLLISGYANEAMAENTQDEELQGLADEYNKKQGSERRKLVCRKEAVIGTRIPKKVCRTVATLEQEQREAKKILREVRIPGSREP